MNITGIFILNPLADETEFDLSKLKISHINPPSLAIEWYIGDTRLANFLLAEADISTLLEQSQHANIRFLDG